MTADQVVLITGASRGFGAAAARLIASRGNTVIATMRNPGRDAAAVVSGFEERIHPCTLDVTDPAQVAAVVQDAVARFGRIDVLINNAGYGLYGPVEDVSEPELWRQVDTNLLGQWRMMKAVIPHMRRRRSGKIANVSSLSGRVSGRLLGHYAATKHGVEAMSEAARYELRNAGVQVTIVEPGMYASDWQTTNLDVCETVRAGQSAYPGVKEALDAFRDIARTRPGSGSVAAAMADIVELEQPLPLRWPVGNDSVHMIHLRTMLPDELWSYLRRAGALGGFRAWQTSQPAPLSPAQANWRGENVVIITGGSRGFGEAAARELAARGNQVVATMRDPGRDADAVVKGFEGRIRPVQLDVTDSAGVERVVQWTIERFGRVDAVINNAGYGLYGPVEDFTEEEVRRQVDTNFVGQWRLCRAVLPHMRERKRGKIANVSSISGVVSSPLMAFYSGSKHMVEAMTEALADEVESFGIQVTAIEPGMYRSDWQTTNLDVCAAIRDGHSAYQRGVERTLRDFRARAITRPGSDAVGQAMADIVQLEQPLPLRWPIGDDAVQMIQARRDTPDDEWERTRVATGWGFTEEELKESGAFAPVA